MRKQLDLNELPICLEALSRCQLSKAYFAGCAMGGSFLKGLEVP